MNRLLVALRKTEEKVVLNNKGICGNVQYYIHEMTKPLGGGLCEAAANSAEHQMRKLMQKWPKCADEYGNFPIEGRWAGYETDAALGKLWENPLRHELLDWMIKELENEENVRPNLQAD